MSKGPCDQEEKQESMLQVRKAVGIGQMLRGVWAVGFARPKADLVALAKPNSALRAELHDGQHQQGQEGEGGPVFSVENFWHGVWGPGNRGELAIC